jgi:hypothetical protein
MVHSFVLELHISGLFPSFYYSKINNLVKKFLSNKTMEKVQKCEVQEKKRKNCFNMQIISFKVLILFNMSDIKEYALKLSHTTGTNEEFSAETL